MKAVKGNKVYSIDEKAQERYANDGFDITDDNGNVVKHGKGKIVPYEQYAAIQKENESLKAQLDAIQKENEGAKQETPASKRGKAKEGE